MGIDFSDRAAQLHDHGAGGNFGADGKLHVFADDRQVEWIIARYLRYAEMLHAEERPAPGPWKVWRALIYSWSILALRT